jgi:hypothetical protein
MTLTHLALTLFFVVVAAPAQVITVSPAGPIKTLSEARDAARAQRRSGSTGPITITVHAGTYFLPETLILGPEDSDTIWEAAHGEHPVISGGRIISGWTKTFGAAWTTDAPGPYFHQLFTNDRRAIRVRMSWCSRFNAKISSGPIGRMGASSRGTISTMTRAARISVLQTSLSPSGRPQARMRVL